jgi:hypothetical protein
MPGTDEETSTMAHSPFAALATAGDLTGNWSWTVWLLIPLVLVLGYVTARCLGPDGAPGRAHSSTRGVSTYLDRQVSSEGGER